MKPVVCDVTTHMLWCSWVHRCGLCSRWHRHTLKTLANTTCWDTRDDIYFLRGGNGTNRTNFRSENAADHMPVVASWCQCSPQGPSSLLSSHLLWPEHWLLWGLHWPLAHLTSPGLQDATWFIHMCTAKHKKHTENLSQPQGLCPQIQNNGFTFTDKRRQGTTG